MTFSGHGPYEMGTKWKNRIIHLHNGNCSLLGMTSNNRKLYYETGDFSGLGLGCTDNICNTVTEIRCKFCTPCFVALL